MGEKRKAEVEAPASSSRPRLSEEESLGPDLASLEGLRAIRALPDLCGGRALAAASRGWFWRVKDSLLGGIVSRLRGTQSVLRQRASRLELWEIEALLPQMETSVKDFCELWCQLRNRLEMELRTNCWRRLAQELAPGVAELELCQVETQSFTMPAVSVLPPPPHGPPPPPPATAAAPFQGPVTMPLLGNVTAAFPAVGPAAANATIPAGPLPTVNMPGTLPGPLLGAAVLPLNGAPMGLPPRAPRAPRRRGPRPRRWRPRRSPPRRSRSREW
ncbi:unnamed protein product [Effrenium voratum]|uniref:Uncharacterized protein n=1 Tax=Effrenium voratum TaxID=2562239 RepID=A0AA36NAY5_9DINO|nr:unnamed protein product [Effrenium voratum]